MSFNVNKNKSYIIKNQTEIASTPEKSFTVQTTNEDGEPVNHTFNLPETKARTLGQFYLDGSDSLANRGMNIGFTHVPTGKQVTFKAFITAFNETYNSDWASEQVFGRTDPIYMFKNIICYLSFFFEFVWSFYS